MIQDIPVLLKECAPSAHHTVLNALIKTESGGDPFVIHDNNNRSAVHSRTSDEAITKAEDLIRQGHSVDMGLAQINSRNLSKLGLSVHQVFDPCTNIKAASTIYSWGLKMAVDKYGEGQQATLAALSVYNTGSLSAGFSNGYVQKVASKLGIEAHINYASFSTHSKATISPYGAPLSAGSEFGGNIELAQKASTNPRFSPLTATGF
jgi:type IV secretion system protein VirB1